MFSAAKEILKWEKKLAKIVDTADEASVTAEVEATYQSVKDYFLVIKDTIKDIKLSAPEIKNIKETDAEKLSGSQADSVASIEGIADDILTFKAFVAKRFMELRATATASGSATTLSALSTAGTDITTQATAIQAIFASAKTSGIVIEDLETLQTSLLAIKTIFKEAATVAQENLSGTDESKALKKETKAKGKNFESLDNALKATKKTIKAFKKANPESGAV